MDDVAAAESALKVGHYVEVKGHSHNSADHNADVIRYHNVLEGPITSIDETAENVRRDGAAVQVTAETAFGDGIETASIAGLVLGDVVEVSGMVATLGVIDATRIDIKPDGGPYDVTGYVTGWPFHYTDSTSMRSSSTTRAQTWMTSPRGSPPTVTWCW